MKLNKYNKNPILSPNPENSWESLVTTNPGAWYDENKDEFLLLYRAAGNDDEHIIHLGLAKSKDGIKFKRVSDEPVLSPSENGPDGGCIEDPRIIKMNGYYYITYAARPFPPGKYWLDDDSLQLLNPFNSRENIPIALKNNLTRSYLAVTKDLKIFQRVGCLTDPMVDDRDVILFPEKINGKYLMLHRPMSWIGEAYGIEYPTIWIAEGDDWLNMGNSKILIKPKYNWENKLGGNTPPIKTERGWLTLYHAVGPDDKYRIGALLLDLSDPSIVLHRTPDWLLEPEEWYELEGFYNGVIFPCGMAVKNDLVYVYYGGADKYIGLATCSMKSLLKYLLSCPA